MVQIYSKYVLTDIDLVVILDGLVTALSPRKEEKYFSTFFRQETKNSDHYHIESDI